MQEEISQNAINILSRLKSASKISSDLELAEKLGIKANTLSGWKKRGIADYETIFTFCELNKISVDWLLNIDKNEDANKLLATEPEEEYKTKGIPLLPLDAFAGLSNNTDYSVSFDTIEERYNVPLFEGKGVDFMIAIRGNSMYPKYNSGDVVACKFVKEVLFVQWNKVYVIDTKSQGSMIKRLKKAENPAFITCKSDNKDYEPFDVPVSDIRNMALVIGVIRLE